MTMLESKFLSYNPTPWKVPETFRIQWASENDKNYHGSIISGLSNIFQRAELNSVLAGRRKSCIVCRDLNEIVHDSMFVRELQKNGCQFIVLGFTSRSDTYSNEVQPPTSIQDTQARILVYRDKPDMTLGYPECCREFFKDIWEIGGHRDTIPFQLKFRTGDINNYHPYCNVMAKGLGLRIVPHLPCSMDCNASELFAATFLSDFTTNELESLHYYLNLETEYSCYHGYAEVKTKHFKLMFNSLPLGSKYTATLKSLIQLKVYSENGFVSLESEKLAHNKFIDILRPFFLTESGNILDLGCGDGSLLHLIHRHYPSYHVEGVEMDARKARLASAHTLIYNQDIYDFKFTKNYDLVLIANQRLEEMTDFERESFLDKVKKYVRYFIVYDYTGEYIPLMSGFIHLMTNQSPNFSATVMVPYATESIANPARFS